MAAATAKNSELEEAKKRAEEALQHSQESWQTQEQLFLKEKVEIEERFQSMESQNSLLHDQIQTLNTQLSVLQAQATEGLNVSIGDPNISNRSMTEDEVKSSDQLFQVSVLLNCL